MEFQPGHLIIQASVGLICHLLGPLKTFKYLNGVIRHNPVRHSIYMYKDRKNTPLHNRVRWHWALEHTDITGKWLSSLFLNLILSFAFRDSKDIYFWFAASFSFDDLFLSFQGRSRLDKHHYFTLACNCQHQEVVFSELCHHWDLCFQTCWAGGECADIISIQVTTSVGAVDWDTDRLRLELF